MIEIRNRLRWANPLYLFAGTSLTFLLALLYLLGGLGAEARQAGQSTQSLFMFCAAGLRPPVEQVAADYLREYGVQLQLQYGGSNTLLNQIEVGNIGDLYLAADENYLKRAHEKGLVQETIPVATMRPVIAVQKGNPRDIQRISDLSRDGVRVALGNPDQASIGQVTRRLLQPSGLWSKLQEHVTHTGVFKPTVNEVANDVKLGSVDAAIVWDTTVATYPELQAIRVPELDEGAVLVSIGILSGSRQPVHALRFARFLAARDRGLRAFEQQGYKCVVGDVWAVSPELTFFAGTVNRKALDPIIDEFERREGVQITTVYNGCGILTAQMRSLIDKRQTHGFPDAYMACDVYYLDTVREFFQDAVNVSHTDIVIVVPKGNPPGIRRLADLARPGVRVALGQPDQCTIGVLSRRLLQSEGIYEQLLQENVVTQTTTSALLVPSITTGSADAALAYATDTLAERDKLDVITIDSPLARAVQPYGIARSSDYKYLSRRLFDTIARSRASFEAAGFAWDLASNVLTDANGKESARESRE